MISNVATLELIVIVLPQSIEFFEPSIFERIVGGINLMGVRCSNASFEKNIFLFVRASSANSKFRLFFSGFEVRCLWWCWRAVQRLFLLLKSSGRVYYDCYYYPKGVGKEKGTGRGRYREKKTPGSGDPNTLEVTSPLRTTFSEALGNTFSVALRMERRTVIVFWVLHVSNGLADSNYFDGFRVWMGRPIFFYVR